MESTFENVSESDAHQTPECSQGHPPKTRNPVHSRLLFIANIPYDTTSARLKEAFWEQIGFSGFLRLFKTNNKPNGFATMEFKTLEGAEKAIEAMNQYEIDNRKLVVREPTQRDLERLSQMESDSHVALNAPGNVTPAPLAPAPAILQQQSSSTSIQHASPLESAPISALCAVTPVMLEQLGLTVAVTDSVNISGLDAKFTWQNLHSVFNSFGCVTHAAVRPDAGKLRNFGTVKFSQPYEAILAVATLDNQVIHDRAIRVRMDRNGTPAPPTVPLFPHTPEGISAAGRFLNGLIAKVGPPPPPVAPVPYRPPAPMHFTVNQNGGPAPLGNPVHPTPSIQNMISKKTRSQQMPNASNWNVVPNRGNNSSSNGDNFAKLCNVLTDIISERSSSFPQADLSSSNNVQRLFMDALGSGSGGATVGNGMVQKQQQLAPFMSVRPMGMPPHAPFPRQPPPPHHHMTQPRYGAHF